MTPLKIASGWSTFSGDQQHSAHSYWFRRRFGIIFPEFDGLRTVSRLLLNFVPWWFLTKSCRWADGRKYWSLLIQTSRNLARTIWVNTKEREGELGKEDLLQKLYVGIRCKRPQLYTIFSDNTRTAMNLILAFAVALKHKLRFEPDIAYDDLAGLVGYLDTFAKDAHDRQRLQPQRKSLWKSTGEYLGVSFAESNPRKLVKRSKKPLGHLPLEILNHLSAYIDRCIANDTLSISLHQAQASMCHPGICDAIVTIDTNLNSSQRPRYPERSRHGNWARPWHPSPDSVQHRHRANRLDLRHVSTLPTLQHPHMGDHPRFN